MSNIRSVCFKDKERGLKREKYTDLRRREAMVDNIEEAVVRHRVSRLLCKSQTTFWSGSLG